MVVAAAFVPPLVALFLELIADPPLAVMCVVYAAAVLMVAGWSAAVPAAIVAGVAVAFGIRTTQVVRSLQALRKEIARREGGRDLTLLLQIGAALGGLSFLGGLVTALALWRKSKAEAKKAGADATSVLTDTALKAATSAIENVEKQAEKLGRQLTETQGELEKTRNELKAVRRHMDVLETLLRQHQIPAPEFVWPPHRNGAAG